MNNRMHTMHRSLAKGVGVLVLGLALSGCHQDMWNQPRFTALQPSAYLSDGASSRPRVEGTVMFDGKRRAWYDTMYAELTGELSVPSTMDERFYTGRDDDGYLADNYFPVTAELIARGQERFNAICSHCHGYAGNGQGVVVTRGMTMPTSYHIDRLREVEDGYFFDVITNGYGRMYAHADKVVPEDRWAIAAYIRALQYSQNVDITDGDSVMAIEVRRGMGAQEEETRGGIVLDDHSGESHGADH